MSFPNARAMDVLAAFLRPVREMKDRASRVEILIGRGAAMCAHPFAAWRLGSSAVRAWVLFAYFGAGYLAVLGALAFVLSSLPRS
jgi:hypothetical protein